MNPNYLRESDFEERQEADLEAQRQERARAFRVLIVLLVLFWLAIAGIVWSVARGAESSGARSALLTWTAPTTNTDGSAITGTVTYRVYRGAAGQQKTQVATTPNRQLLLTGQPLGRQCYHVTAFTTAESAPSAEACKTMTLSPPTDGAIER